MRVKMRRPSSNLYKEVEEKRETVFKQCRISHWDHYYEYINF